MRNAFWARASTRSGVSGITRPLGDGIGAGFAALGASIFVGSVFVRGMGKAHCILSGRKEQQL
jgi:hypothetical protein